MNDLHPVPELERINKVCTARTLVRFLDRRIIFTEKDLYAASLDMIVFQVRRPNSGLSFDIASQWRTLGQFMPQADRVNAVRSLMKHNLTTDTRSKHWRRI